LTTDLMSEFKNTLEGMEYCPFQYGDKKYHVESFLTRLMHRLADSACPSLESDRSDEEGFLGYCDMGEHKTPLLLDHVNVIPISVNGGKGTYLPCHFHLRHGIRITSIQAFASHAVAANVSQDQAHECIAVGNSPSDDTACRRNDSRRELHLYAVPTGRIFMFAADHVNEITQLPHVTGADPHQLVYLQTLSIAPRVFEIFNFFSKDESSALVRTALAETRESHRIKRSSTGAQGYSINAHRTSESGYDTSSGTAVAIKR
jgi:hypothetical protein